MIKGHDPHATRHHSPHGVERRQVERVGVVSGVQPVARLVEHRRVERDGRRVRLAHLGALCTARVELERHLQCNVI